ncbi:hypothetical protein GcM1_182010 [Golovinomyces cichoracearum]|uniref:Uncharacterized protein n=1 Tax=Golovinomyces cichoracearum TaxID=62708 RepID=A0A420J3T9_9PEZI|nr:hypothetical protein GcM1_182010 [Golovinomyces cichoracearum]
MQHVLDESLRNDAFIHNKIVTVCEGQTAFKDVCERPSNNISDLLSDLRPAAELHHRTQATSTYDNQESLFTNRRFIYKNDESQNSCIVFSKQGYWSTNHLKKIEGESLSFESEVESEIDDDKDSEDPHESFIFDTEILETSPKQFPSNFLADTSDEIDGSNIEMALTNKATLHALIGFENKTDLQQITNRYGPNKFEGIVIDTGATHHSTGGYEQ